MKTVLHKNLAKTIYKKEKQILKNYELFFIFKRKIRISIDYNTEKYYNYYTKARI